MIILIRMTYGEFLGIRSCFVVGKEGGLSPPCHAFPRPAESERLGPSWPFSRLVLYFPPFLSYYYYFTKLIIHLKQNTTVLLFFVLIV